ncbi:LysR family transcriptional regulator [Longispora fulva]|uniref:DNA-binding transcriptional LysR family regulator n=1 Tax=Longispora fulva TaxID=619741 RepID=A0A8J7GR46_9ACTN|nr:LysR substrate-binding domain-containing protein [Longispora fulva]MBG6135421.1 DNA-binding transcriptional LysR family regulator [Longispora fulva]GIG56336.1 LysR family transcriptional regulator [Longispora fulva]
MLDVRRLRLLCDLAQLGTIAAVARSHTYSPSAVSQQLAVLEREAGVPLLERTGRTVVLTPAGVVLVRHAEAVLAALEGASAALATVGGRLSGPLRIGAFPTAVRTLLPAALVTLGREHPGLELRVTELDPVAVPEALRERRLDVALVHDYDIMPVEPDQALDAVALLEETVYLAVPVDSPDLGGDPVGGARHAAWIVGSPGTACHAVATQVCRTAGFTPLVRHHADDFAAVLALVAAGQGVSLVPQLAAAQPPVGVRLVPLAARRRTRVTYRRGAATHPAVAACVAALHEATAAWTLA